MAEFVPIVSTLASDEIARVSERFWSKVDKNGPISEARPDLGPCWVWGAQKVRGYGRFQLSGRRSTLAHRVAYELEIGPIGRALTLDHLCRNHSCVRPSHLEAVSSGVNTLRGDTIVAAHAAKTHCPDGHPYDEANTYRYRGRRTCRKCQTATTKRYRLRKQGKEAA